MIRLKVLGTTDLKASDGRVIVSILSQPKRLALLAYLACEATGAFVRREKLLALFWPELDSENARAALRRSLSYLRRSIGDGVIVTRGDDEVGIASGVLECDAIEFEAALDRGDLESGWNRYQGPLLDGLFVAGSSRADQWIEDERRRLERRASDAAIDQANEAERRGDLTDAIRWTERSLALEPYREGTLRQLMMLLAAAGEHGQAAESYEAFAARLAADLDEAPSAETRAILHSIGAAGALAAVGPSAMGEEPTDASMWARAQPMDQPRGSGRGVSRAWMWSTALLAGVVLGLSAFAIRVASEHGGPRVSQLNVQLPDSLPLVFVGEATLGMAQPSLALSPDGRTLAFVGSSRTGQRLFTRSMDDGGLTPLPGTDGAFGPFFSTDGAWIGFFAGGQLKRVSSDGTQVQPLLSVDAPLGGSWADDGRIAAVINDGGPLAIIPPGGGESDILTAEGTLIAQPFWLPESEWILLTCYDPKHLCVMSTSGELRHLTMDGDPASQVEGARLVMGSNPRFLSPGYLVYSASSRNALLGVRFDAEKHTVLGEPEVVYDGVRREAFLGAAQATMSASGDLALARGRNGDEGQFVWVTRTGETDTVPVPPRVYGGFTLSPDGRHLAARVYPPVGEPELWLMDLARGGQGERWRDDALVQDHLLIPTAWLPDSKHLLAAALGNPNLVLEIDPGPPTAGRVLWSGSERGAPMAVTTDGYAVVRFGANRATVLSRVEIGELPNMPAVPSETLTPLVPPFTGNTTVDVSPDGGWVAYHAQESGIYQVFAVPSDGHLPPVRVSSTAGEVPRWSPKGDGLYYRYGRRFFWTPFTGTSERPFGDEELFLEGDYLNVNGVDLAVSPDGSRLLLLAPGGHANTSTLDVTLNFRARLAKLLGPT